MKNPFDSQSTAELRSRLKDARGVVKEAILRELYDRKAITGQELLQHVGELGGIASSMLRAMTVGSNTEVAWAAHRTLEEREASEARDNSASPKFAFA